MPTERQRSGPVAIDAMGGDHAPAYPVQAALEAAQAGQPVTLVGPPGALAPFLPDEHPPELTIQAASGELDRNLPSPAAVRRAPDASLCTAVRLVSEGQAVAAVSAGHSGALLAAGLVYGQRVASVPRPCLASAFPTAARPVTVVDLGANVDPSPVQLAGFALLGHAFAQTLLGRPQPKIALLSNGTEPETGTSLTRATDALLRQSHLDYAGYCEGSDLFRGHVDVVVTDGFTGNVVLKTVEGLVARIHATLEGSALEHIRAENRARLESLYGSLQRKLDYEEIGGAPLLGLQQTVLVAHGRSSVRALTSAIAAAHAMAHSGIEAAIAKTFAAHDGLLTP